MSRCTAVFLLVVFAAAAWNIANADEEPKESPKALPLRHPAVTSVDCYNCVSCSQITNDTPAKTCPYNPDLLKSKKCIKFAERILQPVHDKNVSWVIRGCASERGSCEDIKKSYVLNSGIELDYCTECEGDKCNGVSRSVSDMFFAFFAVVLVPIFGKYILS